MPASRLVRLVTRCAGPFLTALIAILVLRGHLSAANQDIHIREILVGANGNARIQFIVIEQGATGQNLWGPQGGEAQSRAMLVFFDATGRETGKFKFPTNPPAGGSLQTLIATRDFANLPGAPAPDGIIPPLLNAISGKVCFKSNPANVVFLRNECVSYGAFSGDTETNFSSAGSIPAGLPAASGGLPIVNTVSLRRIAITDRNADFLLTTTPTPTNIAGATFSIPVSSQVAQGETLFNNETFLGNGRTCGSCHVASESLRLSASNIQSRFATVASTYDPLFIAETKPSAFDAGFDFNLNTLNLVSEVVSDAPCTGELRGIVTTQNGGRAKVLTRVSPTTYLVYGGKSPGLSGTVVDSSSCSGTVASITAGSLAPSPGSAVPGLEVPRQMRMSPDFSFPPTGVLILENIDGFSSPPVFRKSPHLLNLSRTALFGFSGNIPDLQTFAAGAVVQHFPRTLARTATGANPDFRLPTPEELAAIEAFLLAQEFPAGDDPNKFDLDRFASTTDQRLGRSLFFGSSSDAPGTRCAHCHGGPTLSQMTVPLLGRPVGVNASLNTGVVNKASNFERLPCEPSTATVGLCGSREFSVPSLFNIKNLLPLFHNGSARSSVVEAVTFYFETGFTQSPAGRATALIFDNGLVTRFLEGLVVKPYALSEGPVRFGSQGLTWGATPGRTITITNTSSSPITFSSPACQLTGPNTTEFIIQSCPLAPSLAPGQSKTIQVAFDPISNGLKTAILEINAPDPSGIDLFGVGGPLTAPPALVAIAPASGQTSGGDSVTIAGANFTVGVTVTFGGVRAGFVSVVNSTTITARTGAHAAGAVDVVVTNPDAQTQTLSGAFTYSPPLPLTVTSISPNSDLSVGRTTVTIQGTGFTSRSAVSIGGVLATNVTMVTGTTITAATGPHPAGTVDVAVRNPDGQTSTLTNGFTYVGAPAPTVSSVVPASGLSVGGGTVTIAGTGFASGTTVTIGGVPATALFNGVAVTSLRVVTGPHAPGSVDVVVANSDGQTATRSSGFTYTTAAAPTISSVTPSSGSILGGTTVSISGTGFASGVTVTIGGVTAFAAATGFVTGAHAPGTVDVVVTNPDGQSATKPGGFVYIAAAPSVASIEPSSGPIGGGAAVTIRGANFVGGATVAIGGVNATNVVLVDSMTITATAGAHSVGAVNVLITNPDTQAGSLTAAFVYGPPTATAVAPVSGAVTGGTALTITGTNFITGDVVMIGGVAAINTLVVNASTITATTSPHAAGLVDVVVTNNGQSALLANNFTYFNPVVAPTVTAIAPPSGATAGGTPVTITGANFATGATVAIGGVAATGVTVVDATTITAMTGPHAAGSVDVVVTNLDTQRGTRVSGFAYVPPPTVASIAPLSGPMAGSTGVTITGSNFAAGATVAIGGVAAAGVVVVNATTITATTGAHAVGLADVVVTNPDAQNGARVSGFTYFDPLLAPTVTAITPASGPTTGGTSLTITGTKFVAGAVVSIGGTAMTASAVVSPTTMTATTGAHVFGVFDVVVTNADTQIGTLQSGFTFMLPPPTVTAILPSSGSTQGSTSVTITGTNFVTGATVTIGGVAATNVQVTNATTVTAATAPHAAEGVSVVVTNPDSQLALLPSGFTYGAVSGYTFTTLAGSSGGFGSVDGTSTAARLFNPGNAAVDSIGNVYVADTNNHTIRKITPSGNVTTLAGSAGNAGSVDGTGSAARFNAPLAVAVDASFNVFVADTANHTIRKITPAGVVTTLAGSAGTPGSADGTGNLARFFLPSGATVDSAGNIFVADTQNHTIRKIFVGGAVTTFAGLAGVPGSANGFGSAARFNMPRGIALDNLGRIVVADAGNHMMRNITAAGASGNVAGTAGSPGSVDGVTFNARFNSPQSVTVDRDGTIYVADTLNHTIRMFRGSTVTTLAGLAGSAGRAEGTGTGARFSAPGGVAIDATGNLYISDTSNHALRKMTMSTGVVTTLAGAPSNGSIDNTTAAALFATPSSVAVDGSGNVYIADTFNHTIRKITPGGIVTTLAGSAGNSGSADGTGAAARFFLPSGVAVDASGAVFVADTSNHTIRRITPAGVVTTFVGLAGTIGSADGTGNAARFNFPNAVAVDGSGTVFVTDTANQTIRKITAGGVVTTLAGAVGNFGSVDGTGAAARFLYPAGVAVDGSGTVFVADTDNHTIRKITSAGVVTTLAGAAGTGGSADGTSTAARFTFPFGVAVDIAGNVYVADAGNHTIRQITPAGVVTTIGGLAGTSGSADGTGTEARFFLPTSVAVERTGTLYVADALNNSIRKGVPPPPGSGLIAAALETVTTVPRGPQSVAVGAVRTAPPFGQVETPVQGATGLTGTIAMGGWALDDADLGVASVKVYRNCVTFENQANCQTLGGANVVYLGDATFVVGARPDVEAAFPTYPAANRAGWAYVLLTNTLPHVPDEGLVGGQGPFTLFAYATDREGNVTLLGRAPVDHTPTTIAVDNDGAAAPFGWIDAPAENAIVSGTVNVSGWALTPDNGRGVLIPRTGSAITLFVDGVATSVPVEYNRCRGTVGTTVASGTYCDDDVANIFGNSTPRAMFMPRTSNPSRYRNLDAGAGAIAVASLDTTALRNGLHIISWNVSDSAGRTANVGTRGMLVQNGGASAANSPTSDPAEVRQRASVLDGFVGATGVVWGRAGFDVESPLDVVVSDANGVLQMRIPMMGRVELRLGSVDAGYLLANGSLRDLPPGSQIDPATGAFTWAPGPAYLGTYRLEFLQGGAHLSVDVTTRPTSSGTGAIRVGLDGPAEIVSTGPVTISGWAVDPEAWTGSGVDAVHVYAYRRNSVAAPIFLGAAQLNVSRPDVAQAFGPSFGQAGFRLTTTLVPGDYDLRLFVFLHGSGQSEEVRSVHATTR